MGIKLSWRKRTFGTSLLALAMILTLLPTPVLAADTRSASENAIVNGSFETPATNQASAFRSSGQVTGWNTTATDDQIELGGVSGNRHPHLNSDDGVTPDLTIPDGKQFVELNAHQASTLYQYAATTGGNVYEWGLSHRGRYGTDSMALIIGPKQDVKPDKPNKAGKDQFMQMTDWVRYHAAEMGVTISDTGCTQWITVYSKKFDEKGGFKKNADNDPFSASPSDVYTEKWNVWIIGTGKNHWGNYGTNAEERNYSCRYAVPDRQSNTVFAFSSYAAAGNDPTNSTGNLIDNIHFSLYQTITIGANGGGNGSLTVSADDKDEIYEVGSGNGAEALAPNGGTVTVRAKETSDTQFLGAYVTRQTPNGVEREFIPAKDWEKQEDGSYIYRHKVAEPADIALVFIRKMMVEYDANGGYSYSQGDNGGSTVTLTDGSSYTAQSATAPDGWQFQGWMFARDNVLLPGNHQVTRSGDKLTFTGTDAEGKPVTATADGGATLIAQWQWRQRFVVQVKNGGDFTNDTACGTVTAGGTTAASVDCYAGASERVSATAAASSGYHFLGWYDSDGQFLDNSATYSYSVDRGSVRTVYARFAKVHTVTYEWTEEADKCPTDAPKLPDSGTVIDGGTYVIDQTYTKGYAIDGTVTENNRTIPGKWVFTGWRSGESGDSDIRETELINVTGDRTLTGYWTFEPEAAYTLTYQFADDDRWSPSGSFEQTENYYRGEKVTAQSEPARNRTPDGKDVLVTGDVTLYGDWTFKGWERSDKADNAEDAEDAVISAGDVFFMPGNNLTLTGQWEFTPYTYTVVYDLGNGTIEADPNNKNYDYSKLLGSSKLGCNAPPTGIPFGASIELMELPDGTAIPEGKYFAGWSLVDPKNADLSTVQTQEPGDSVGFRKLGVTKDEQVVTLYAVYKDKDLATVDFAVNDSNWGDVDPRSGSFTVQNGKVDAKTVSSTATPRDGYHFAGWYEKNDKGKLTPVSASAINDTTLTVTSEMMQKKLASLTADEDATEAPVLVVHYVAVFARDSFTVQFDANGALDDEGKSDVTGKMEPQTFNGAELEDQSTTLRKNAFVRPGYEFAGWAEYPSGDQGRTYSDEAPFAEVKNYQGAPIKNDGEITLYARWKEIDPVTIIYTAAPASLGTVKLNADEAAVENDIAVQDGSIYEKLNPVTGKARGAVAEPGEGSVFVGWFDYNDTERKTPLTTDGVLTYIPGPDLKTGLYKNSSYVAVFRQKQYVLHYDANSGTGTMEDQIFPHGQAHSLRECTFLRDGYDFVGWAKNASATKIDYVSQQSINLNAEFPTLTDDGDTVTLYAVWQERDVTLNYASSDETLGTVSNASESVKAANGVPAGSTAQAKNGARFDGWYSVDGTLLSTELTFVPTKADGAIWQGTTYYARFSAQRRPSAPSTPEKPDDTKTTLAPIPAMLNGEDHYAFLLGYEDGTVRPNGNISRAEVATVLFRLLKDDVRTQNLTKDNAYSDVSDTAWYAAAVSTLSKMGIISGYPDGTFRPNAPITRAEFAAMIARFDETAEAADTPFTDISGHWAENAIGKAYGNGWVEGSSKTAFCPESNLTRAETATLLNRVLHRLPEAESDLLANQIVWPDNPESFWGYLAMQEATNSHEYERKADGVHETQTAKRENRDWSKEFEQ